MLRSRLRTMVLAVAMMVPVAGVRAQDADKLFPRDSEIVAQFNVRQLLDSALVTKYLGEQLKNGLKDEETAKTFKALNLDPMKDITRVTLAAAGTDPNDARLVIVVDGRFDTKAMGESIATYARTNPKEFGAEKLGEKTVYKITNEKMPTPVYLGIVSDKQLVLASKKETLTTAFAGTGKNELSEEMAKLVAGMNKTATMSMVASIKGKLDALPINDDETRKLLNGAESLSMQLNLDKGFGLTIGLGMDKPASAAAMSKKLGELVGLGKLLLPNLAKDQPDLKPVIGLLNSVKETAKGNSAQLELKLSEEDLLKFVPKE